MDHDPRAYLWDARESANAITEFVRGRTFEDYASDSMLRSAVERQFEIIGEALRRLEKTAPELALRLPERSKAIAFRNILIHGYDSIDHSIVWLTIHDDLPALRAPLWTVCSQSLGRWPRDAASDCFCRERRKPGYDT
jgi:uncharacterized protein with HEPN domain